MKPSEGIRPISFLKSHTAAAIRDVRENRQTLIITQNGEAKAILQDIAVFEESQDSLALLKMLAQRTKHREAGRSKSVNKAFANVRRKVRKPAE